jgi:hypothetical protein
MKSSLRTKNQHFISQAEQRLNACNPQGAPERQRVYSFLVADHGTCDVRLENARGIKIRNNLAWTDLFTFDAAGLTLVPNLESCFQDYEQTIARQSQALLFKLQTDGQNAGIKDEILNIFAAKFLNFLRNPYSVVKALNTVGPALQFIPTEPRLAEAFAKITANGDSQQRAVCRRFDLTTEQYWNWLKALFLMLMRDPSSSSSMFEQLVVEMFEQRYVIVMVYHYTALEPRHVCLLSDRGFSVPHEGDAMMAIDFNIAATAFVRYIFCDIDGMAPEGTPQDVIADLKEQRRVRVVYTVNDIDALARYNRLALHQCHRRVYAAAPSFVLAGGEGTIAMPTA